MGATAESIFGIFILSNQGLERGFQWTRLVRGGTKRMASTGHAATQLPSYQHSLPKTT
jgi:hypothetical protein